MVLDLEDDEPEPWCSGPCCQGGIYRGRTYRSRKRGLHLVAGRKGDGASREGRLKDFWAWLKTVKAPISYVIGMLAAGAAAQGKAPLAAVLGAVAAWLNGAGVAPSDREEKTR